MNLNFPYREAIVVRDHELRVTRRFPIDSDIKVRAGARVKAEDVFGRSDPRLSAIRLAVAAQLDCLPRTLAAILQRRSVFTLELAKLWRSCGGGCAVLL